MNQQTILVGSRDSKLAVVQTQLMIDAVRAAHPELAPELITMKTTGDLILDQSLDKLGGKGLFVKELDQALREHRADITIHSLKDMPAEIPTDLPLLAFSQRGDACDALVLPLGVPEIDVQKPVGCGSARRSLQLKRIYPHLQTKLVRGNVITRLQKLDNGEYCALILSAAGLARLGLEHRISRIFTPQEMIPAAGQAILVVQGRAGEDYGYLDAVDNKEARVCAYAERAFVRVLDGGCGAPIAAYAQVTEGGMHLMGLYCDETTGRHATGELDGTTEDAVLLGETLAKRLKEELFK